MDELLLTEIRDMLLEFLTTCITGGVPLEIAGIRAKEILAKAKPIIEKQIAYGLFEEIICPLCYRLNPQHVTMDNGKGCHYCQEREDWQALKEEK